MQADFIPIIVIYKIDLFLFHNLIVFPDERESRINISLHLQ